jgi:FAD/FMN-containing dehydrogenase
VKTAPTKNALSDLRVLFGARAIGPDDAGYDGARAVFSPAIDRRPALVVRPVDAAEVAEVVAFARTARLELAVRGGGHSAAGHGASDGGIVLDLSLMRTLSIGPDGRSAWAGAGLTAGEVTAATGTRGLTAGFGDSASVGIAGLTLGGGVGYLVRKLGLTTDQLEAAVIVTADGRLRRADAEQHPDLFWAIRGGGGNFGVVTGLRYRLSPIDLVTGGMLVLPATAEAIASFVDAARDASDELSTIVNVMPAPSAPFIPAEHHGEPVMMATLVHAGPAEAAERELAPFRGGLARPILDTVGLIPYPKMLEQEAPNGPRPFSSMHTMFVDAIDRDVAATILELLRCSTAQMPVAQFRVLGGAMARVPSHATAFAHRSSPIMLTLTALYPSLAEAPAHEVWLAGAASALAQADRGAYVNFLGDEGDDRVRSAYPGRTWERLAAIKSKYDPANLFHLNQNVPPAIAEHRGEAA